MEGSQIGKTAEIGGAAITVGSWAASCLDWMDAHSRAVLAICGIASLLVTCIGALVSWHYKRRADARAERQAGHKI